MKLTLMACALLSILTILPIHASKLIKVECQNVERGLELKLEPSDLENFNISYYLDITFGGTKVLDMVIVRESDFERSDYTLTFLGDHPDKFATEIFIGVSKDRNEVVYQEAANSGLSPLPAIFFKDCDIE